MFEYQGRLVGNDEWNIAIVASRFNELIVRNLVDGALGYLDRHGISQESIHIAWVPGAFEIPLVAKRLASSGKFCAVICLGAVIRGATPHFDFIAGQTTAGVQQTSLETGIPIVLGVLTTDTIEQAIERAGTKAGNKGYQVAEAALEMADLMQQLPAPSEECATQPFSLR